MILLENANYNEVHNIHNHKNTMLELLYNYRIEPNNTTDK